MLKEVIDLACENMRVPLLRLVPYQHLLWTLETRKGVLNSVAFPPFFINENKQKIRH